MIISMSLAVLKGRCHMTAKCVRKCQATENVKDHVICHEGECYPAPPPIEK